MPKTIKARCVNGALVPLEPAGIIALLWTLDIVLGVRDMRAYQARVEPDDDGRWSAWIEELPGCSAWGYSQDEALVSLEEAAAVYLEDMVEAGEADASEVALTIKKPIGSV